MTLACLIAFYTVKMLGSLLNNCIVKQLKLLSLQYKRKRGKKMTEEKSKDPVAESKTERKETDIEKTIMDVFKKLLSWNQLEYGGKKKLLK